MTLEEGQLVTLDLDDKSVSNTYILDTLEAGDKALIRHPAYDGWLKRVSVDRLDRVSATIKDSLERGIDFIQTGVDILSKDDAADLESILLYFINNKGLSNGLKKRLSDLMGKVAKLQLQDNITDAMRLVVDNQGLLDEFNNLWYHNYRKIFNGQQRVSSAKQRTTIFNMAGFVLAELATPTITREF